MTPKLLLILLSSVGITPAVLWALASVATAAVSIAYRPVSLSIRLYSDAGGISAFDFHELPVFTSLCILAGAALLIFGLTSIPRPN